MRICTSHDGFLDFRVLVASRELLPSLIDSVGLTFLLTCVYLFRHLRRRAFYPRPTRETFRCYGDEGAATVGSGPALKAVCAAVVNDALSVSAC